MPIAYLDLTQLLCAFVYFSDKQHFITDLQLVLDCYVVVTDCTPVSWFFVMEWWRHQMEIFSALLALSAGNSPVTGEFPSQRPATRSFDVCLICAWIKPLSKQSWGWWFETPSGSLWRHCNGGALYIFCFAIDMTMLRHKNAFHVTRPLIFVNQKRKLLTKSYRWFETPWRSCGFKNGN